MCSTLFPALCVGVLADEFDATSSLDSSDVSSFDIVSDEFSDDNASVMTVTLSDTSSVGNPTVTFSKPVYFGVSLAQSTYVTSAIANIASSQNPVIATYSLPETTTGTFLQFDAMTEDIVYPVSLSYPDTESIDFYGTATTQIVSRMYPAYEGVLRAYPVSMDILINGSVVSSSYSQGSTVDYTYVLKKGQTVTSIGFRFHYDQYFNLGATEASSNERRLQVLLSSMFTQDNTSTAGWFNALFSWLANIRDGISNVLSAISSGFSNVVNSIVALPAKIADAVKGLFVPSDTQMDELKASFNSLLSDKLGFVYQSVSLIDGVFDAVFDAVDNPDSNVSFSVPAFPSFVVDGSEVSLWDESITVDISSNEVVQTVQRVASPFVIAVMIWGFIHSMEDAFLSFVGGQSLADWVRHRKGDSD